MLDLNLLQCVECKSSVMVSGDSLVCESCHNTYLNDGGVLVALPKKMNELSSSEAHYHDHFDENPTEVHQLDSYRNLFFHNFLWKKINTLPDKSVVLEVGSGSGFDAHNLRPELNLVLSDISPETLKRTAKNSKSNMFFVAADGLSLPFKNNTFDALYIVATFHHFENPTAALLEFKRVLKKGGLLVIGIEPNYLYFSLIKKFRGVLCKAAKMEGEEVSLADAEMVGFKFSDWISFFKNNEWSNLVIKPMWLFSGFVHYFSEMAYRSLRLKKRIRVNQTFEKMIVFIDEFILKIPLLNRLSWHVIVTVNKK